MCQKLHFDLIFQPEEELSEHHEELSEYKIKNPLYLCRTLSSYPFSGI